MMKKIATVMLMAIFPILNAIADTPAKPSAARSGTIKVAFVLSENANLMDIAGPWEVFQDTMLDDGKDTMPFELYTVAPSKDALHATGSGRPGLAITPDYSFADAPSPDIVVVGAQSGGEGLDTWLKRQHAQQKIILSICTGAFKLAKAGLLDGKQATTHHWYFGNFASEFPKVKLVRQVRYVQADPLTFTAGGLTSGVDLALHMVAAYFGEAQAQRTADYMEYQGRGWKSNEGVATLSAPVRHQIWSGKIEAETEVLLRRTTTGASSAFTVDIPAQHIAGVEAAVKSDDADVSISVPIVGHAATFTGKVEAGGAEVPGVFSQDGKSYPLTLRLIETH
jgi:putative intracellular protease/amidase